MDDAAKSQDVMEMCLCEAGKVVLRVNQLYRFVHCDCESCDKALAAAVEAYGPSKNDVAPTAQDVHQAAPPFEAADVPAVERKLRDALRRLLESDPTGPIATATDAELRRAVDDDAADPVVREQAAAVLQGRMALSSVQGDPTAALRGEPEAAGHGSVEGDVRALRQMVADCDVYLKEGETPAQRIDRERRDTEAVLNLLIREKQRTEAMREVMLRMMAGIDHLAEIARQWEPDYSSGADRRGWVLAKDARDDAARLIAETPQAASGSRQGSRPNRTPSQKLADAGFTRRPSLWAMQAREILELIAAPKRADGTWNRDREACRQLAAEALGRDEGLDEQNGGEQGATPPAPAAPDRSISDGEQFWLWRNGDHFLAFKHLYPCFSPGGDPMTLGEPYGRAIFRHSHNREGKPNEQQRTDRQGPRSSTDPDLQRRHAASAGQACSVGAGASLGHSQHPIAPQGGWSAGDDGARPQSVPDIAGAAGVLAAAGNVAEGVAALAASPQPAAPEGRVCDYSGGTCKSRGCAAGCQAIAMIAAAASAAEGSAS